VLVNDRLLRSEMKQSGKYVISNTSGEEVRAFVPDPLPEKFEISEKIRLLLTKAEFELGRLDLATELVPSQEWLLYGFVRKEAVVSSQIEGTQASLVDLLGADEIVLGENPDIEDICNYLAALACDKKSLFIAVSKKGDLSCY